MHSAQRARDASTGLPLQEARILRRQCHNSTQIEARTQGDNKDTLIPTMAVVYCHMAHMAVVAISRTIAGALRGITHIAVDIILALQHGQAIPSHFLAGKKREGTQWICRALHPR